MKISITPEKIDGRDVFAWTVTDAKGEILFASLSDTKDNARNDIAALLAPAGFSASAVKASSVLGCTVEQAQKQLANSIAGLRKMHAKAVRSRRPVNNFTAGQLAAAIERLSK